MDKTVLSDMHYDSLFQLYLLHKLNL